MYNKEKYSNNKEKFKIQSKIYYSKPETKLKGRNREYKKKYNLTLDEYNSLLEKQNYRCKICTKPQLNQLKNLAVDHCHKTGKVRGLLCGKCNKGLGLYNDSILLLTSAIEYLKQSNND